MRLIIFILYAYIFILVAILYILICGGTRFHADGFIGKLNKILYGFCMPQAKKKPDSLNKKEASSGPSFLCCLKPLFKKAENYIFYSKNPLLQLFYLGLLFVNAAYFFPTVFFRMTEVPTLGLIHYITGPIALFFGLGSFFLASYSNPGYITKENFHLFANNYKHSVYYPANRICPTCKIPRLPRSKHCGLSGHCVSRFDHFCPWINNAIGEWNYRYFHLFLFANAIMAYYGTYIVAMYIWGIVKRDSLLTTQYMTPSGTTINSSLPIVLQYLMTQYMWLISQVIFGICIGTMLILFWGYHFVRMVLFNTTTNESFKMADIEEWMNTLKEDPKFFDDEWNDLEDFEKEQVLMLKKLIAQKKELDNPYYISVWENIKEVFFPPSLRPAKTSKFGTKRE